MANETTVTIKGLKELDDLLKQLPAEIEANLMRAAMRSGLKEIGGIAKQMLEAEGHVQSGDLQRSVRVTFDKKQESKYGWMRGKLVAGNKKAWYAHILEFGSGGYYTGKGSKSKRAPYLIKANKKKSLFFAGSAIESVVHPGVKPSPFMRPALDSGAQRAINAVAAYLTKGIPRTIKKLKKNGY